MALEAKRLPVPRSGCEREYLVGPPSNKNRSSAEEGRQQRSESGGVARFKLGIHAPKLKTVGMIGYVQRYSFEYWQNVINGWVDQLMATPEEELRWEESDKLQMEATSPLVAKLRSNNLRATDNERISIRHVWVQLAGRAEPTGEPAGGRSRRVAV